MSEKNQLMSIGEAASSLGITRRAILNYENKGLLLPDVKEGELGNRYYTPDTITRIRTIRVFQNMGLTLEEIRSYFDESADLEPLVQRLEIMRDELNLNIEKLRERTRRESTRQVSFTALPRQTVYRRTLRAASVEEKMAHLREVIPAALRQYGSDTSKRMYFIEFPLDDPDRISYCIAVPEGSQGEYVTELPETQAICIYHHGGYEELPAVRERLRDYAREKGLDIPGTCRHIYLEGPPQHKDTSKYITQVALPIVEQLRS